MKSILLLLALTGSSYAASLSDDQFNDALIMGIEWYDEAMSWQEEGSDHWWYLQGKKHAYMEIQESWECNMYLKQFTKE